MYVGGDKEEWGKMGGRERERKEGENIGVSRSCHGSYVEVKVQSCGVGPAL